MRVKNSLFTGPPRYYKIVTRNGERHKAYRMVAKRGLVGEYYGIQGTTWKDPPILADKSEKKKMGKRTFELHYDGDRLRLVAWRTQQGRLLGVQHPAPDAHRAPDARHRPLDASPVTSPRSWPRRRNPSG